MGNVTLAAEEVDDFLEAGEKTFQLVTNVNKLCFVAEPLAKSAFSINWFKKLFSKVID
jgi:hypothetical protein